MIQDILKPKSKDELSNVASNMHLCHFLHMFEKTSIKGMKLSVTKKIAHFLLNDWAKFYEKYNFKFFLFWISIISSKFVFPIFYANYIIYLMYAVSVIIMTETFLVFAAVGLRIRLLRWVKKNNKKIWEHPEGGEIFIMGAAHQAAPAPITREHLNELIQEMVNQHRIRPIAEIENADDLTRTCFYEVLDREIDDELQRQNDDSAE